MSWIPVGENGNRSSPLFECESPKSAYWVLEKHAKEADRRIAERDELIRELEDAVDHAYSCDEPLTCKYCHQSANLFDRVAALQKEQA
jgi:hypothetical protein